MSKAAAHELSGHQARHSTEQRLSAEQFDRDMLDLGFRRSYYRGLKFPPLDPDESGWHQIRWGYTHEDLGWTLGTVIYPIQVMPDGRHDYALTLEHAKRELARHRSRRRTRWAIVAMLLTIITAWFANGTASATTMTVRDFNAGHALFFDTCTVDLVSVQPFGGEQALTARCEGESTLPIGRPMWTGMIFDEVAVDLRDWQGCALVLWLREAGNEHIEFDCGGVPLHSDGFE